MCPEMIEPVVRALGAKGAPLASGLSGRDLESALSLSGTV